MLDLCLICLGEYQYSCGQRGGALDTNRTCDPPLRRGMLYPLSYEGDDYLMHGWRGKFYA